MCQTRSWAYSHILTHLTLTTIPLTCILLPFISDEERNLETLTSKSSVDRLQFRLQPACQSINVSSGHSVCSQPCAQQSLPYTSISLLLPHRSVPGTQHGT